MTIREVIEQRERETLAPYAALADGSFSEWKEQVRKDTTGNE